MKQTTQLSIKNMVCKRCVRVVQEDLDGAGYIVENIELGNVTVQGILQESDIHIIQKTLKKSGFELIGDEQSKIIEAVKRCVIEHIHHQKEKPDAQNFSDFLVEKTGLNYFSLSKLFSAAEGITINKFIILQKIERIKEYLIYDEKSLGEIAFELGYSSVAHVSAQFKKETGFSPTEFRKLLEPRRKSIDNIGPQNLDT